MFNEFKPTSKQEWLDKVVKDTKGKRALEDFNWQLDSLTVSPFHHQDDIEELLPNLSIRADNNWEIGTSIVCKDPKTANQQALTALESGAQALCFIFEEVPDKKQLEIALTNIQHEWISTHFRAPVMAYPNLINQFLDLLQDKKQDPAKVPCVFSSTETAGDLSAIQTSHPDLPKASFQTVKVAKSDTVRDLAEALVKVNQCLIALAESNIDFRSELPPIQCLILLEDQYFPFLAKVRALRVLVQQVYKAWGVSMPPLKIIAELDEATLSEDENYNRIKMTSQAMSAVTAGIDTLFLSTPKGEETDFSRRISLNIQHLLQQESFMGRVADPAAGSYFIDHLTKELAEQAWALFQQINAQS
ncbi:MAG: hypothetical protein Sapg2KO_01060 [Saprospiraceae bacterium]